MSLLRSLVAGFALATCLWHHPGVFADAAPAGFCRLWAVQMDGLKNLSRQDLLRLILARVGENYSQAQMEVDTEALRSSGYFAEVQGRIENGEEGRATVRFQLVENPKVERIEFLGNRLASREQLLALLETASGSVLNLQTVRADTQRLNRYYTEVKGLELGSFVASAELLQGVLTFDIVEEATIDVIEIEGAKIIPPERVRQVLRSRLGEAFRYANLKRDHEELDNLYNDNDLTLARCQADFDLKKRVLTYRLYEAMVEGFDCQALDAARRNLVLEAVLGMVGKPLRTTVFARAIDELRKNPGLADLDFDFITAVANNPSQIRVVFSLKK